MLDSQAYRDAACAAVSAKRSAIGDDVVATMYRNPFWDDRYGERGRRYSIEDGNYNLDFLTTALQLEDTAGLVHYITWLRAVLVNRGMCTEHLRLTLMATADACDKKLEPEHGLLVRVYLDAALAGLDYTAPAAATLWDGAEAITHAAADLLWAEEPPPAVRGMNGGRERCLADLRYHLCYLADALDQGKPALFNDYVTWVGAFFERRFGSRLGLDEGLGALRQAIASHAPAEHLAAIFACCDPAGVAAPRIALV